jgi:hypothetical protein
MEKNHPTSRKKKKTRSLLKNSGNGLKMRKRIMKCHPKKSR